MAVPFGPNFIPVTSLYHHDWCCHEGSDHGSGSSPQDRVNLTGEQSRDLERKREHWWQACPSCGRRFHIRLVSKKLLHVDTGKEKVFPNVNFLSPRQVGNIIDNELTGEYHTIAPYPLSTEGINVIVTEDFEYLCRCSHCKHEWAEKRTISVS